MKKNIQIENKIVTIYYKENKENKLPVIILNTYGEDGEDIWSKTKENNYILVTISNLDWNNEMSPWPSKNFNGKANDYIKLLENKIIPKIDDMISKELELNIKYHIIGGYSLAGLFAIYSLYKTYLFKSAISCSGSLWYPDLIDYIKSNEMIKTPDKIYFSLGNKESKTKNELMSKVEVNTKYIEKYYKEKKIETIYEENEGNHFKDVIERTVKGINWILK